MEDVLKDEGKREALREQILRFFTAYPSYPGLSLDIENLNDDDTGVPELHPGTVWGDASAEFAPLCERGRICAGQPN